MVPGKSPGKRVLQMIQATDTVKQTDTCQMAQPMPPPVRIALKSKLSPWLFPFLVTIAVILPAIPLFNLYAVFACDWLNDVWLVNYVSEYLRQNMTFPNVINTHTIIGMAYPIFYGYLLFPLLAVVSLPCDGSIALRVVSIGVWALQFALFYKLTLKHSNSKLLALTVASLVIWTIYPMTNLYNRGAMPEFIATGCLYCAIALWFLAITTACENERKQATNASVLLIASAAGAHPITAVYGCLFYCGIMALTAWLVGFKRLLPAWKHMIVPALIAMVCLSPWVYCTKSFVRQIKVSNFDHVNYYPLTLDSPFARLTPFPLPSHRYEDNLQQERVGTPNLDTQINMPMLLLFLCCLAALAQTKQIGRNRLTISLLAVFATCLFMLYLSVHRGSIDHLGYLARSIQFAYRLVTYINLALTAAVLLAIVFHDRNKKLPLFKPALFAILLLSMTGLAIKTQRALATTTYTAAPRLQAPVQQDLLDIPPTFYGSDAYTTFTGLAALNERGCVPEQADVPVLGGTHFGKTGLVQIPENGNWIVTNIHAFAWNSVFINDRRITAANNLAHNQMQLAVNAPGHTLGYKFTPDKTWKLLNAWALPLYFAWIAWTILQLIFSARQNTSNDSARPNEAKDLNDAHELPQQIFHSHHYLRHNQRRQEHLASLNLELSDRSVLELGAGIGDHTSFFLDRGCNVTITEAREENLQILKSRFPQSTILKLDLEQPVWQGTETFDILYCYGILYHLGKPAEALTFLAPLCKELLLLETCVSYRPQDQINVCYENTQDFSQSISGIGCRPSRQFIFDHLKTLFPYVYMPVTQPCHEEFPLDWTKDDAPQNLNNLTRAIYVASRAKLNNPALVDFVPEKQTRH
jgi:hypothetical protein